MLVSAGRGTAQLAAWLGAAAVVVAALALIVALALPWLASRRLDEAVDAIMAPGDLSRADARARRARAT